MKPQFKIGRPSIFGDCTIRDVRVGSNEAATIGWCRGDQIELFERAFAALARELSADAHDKSYREALQAPYPTCS